MTPRESRPAEDGAALETAGRPSTTIPPATDIGAVPTPVEVAPRARGLLREVTLREVAAVCANCGQRFTSTGPAASHAGSARHYVTCDYRARFVYVPRELLP